MEIVLVERKVTKLFSSVTKSREYRLAESSQARQRDRVTTAAGAGKDLESQLSVGKERLGRFEG